MRLIASAGRTALDAAIYGLAILGALSALLGGASTRLLLTFWLIGLLAAATEPATLALRSRFKRLR